MHEVSLDLLLDLCWLQSRGFVQLFPCEQAYIAGGKPPAERSALYSPQLPAPHPFVASRLPDCLSNAYGTTWPSLDATTDGFPTNSTPVFGTIKFPGGRWSGLVRDTVWVCIVKLR